MIVRNIRDAAISVGGFILIAAWPVWARANASIFALGVSSSSAYAVSDSGQVAGEDYNGDFVTSGSPSAGGSLSNIGVFGAANGINDAGDIVGQNEETDQAFVYTGQPGQGGSIAYLGNFGGQQGSTAQAINNSNAIVGWSHNTSNYSNAFLYTGTPGNGGTMSDLGTLGGNTSAAYGINSAGTIVGTAASPASVIVAFIYTGTPGHGGSMQSLGSLGSGESEGLAINNSNQVTGYSYPPSESESQAFLYSGVPGAGGAMVSLGMLNGDIGSEGLGINNLGDVVGVSIGLSQNHAFAYVGIPGAGGTMIDLNSYLAAVDPADAAHWQLEIASSISDTGWIAGWGIYNNGTSSTSKAFELDASSLVVPEPACLSLAAATVGFALLRRRERTCEA